MRKQFEFDKSYVTWFANSKFEVEILRSAGYGRE